MGKINISVSGGNAQFGNVSQGDSNVLDATWQSWHTQANLDEFYSALRKIEDAQQVTGAQVDELKSEVANLTGIEERPNLTERILRLLEKYSWAAGPIKHLFALVLPSAL